MAILSKGITLSYKKTEENDYTVLTNLQEIPDLGGDTEGIDITTLADSAFMYMDGLKEYGDSLEFIFLYDRAQFMELNEITDLTSWKVTLPDGASCSFDGMGSVKLSGVGVNAPLTYVLGIKPMSEMTWAIA